MDGTTFTSLYRSTRGAGWSARSSLGCQLGQWRERGWRAWPREQKCEKGLTGPGAPYGPAGPGAPLGLWRQHVARTPPSPPTLERPEIRQAQPRRRHHEDQLRPLRQEVREVHGGQQHPSARARRLAQPHRQVQRAHSFKVSEETNAQPRQDDRRHPLGRSVPQYQECQAVPSVRACQRGHCGRPAH
jgi:hypothetical protein